MATAIWLLAVTAAAVLASVRWPGWSVAPLRLLWTAVSALGILVGGGFLGTITDPYLREWVPWWPLHLSAEGLPLLAPVGRWFIGPSLPADLLAAGAFVAVLLADARRPGSLAPEVVSAHILRLARGAVPVLTAALPWLSLLPLLWGWSDVLATTAGVYAGQWYDAAATAGLPFPGPRLPAPDPRLPSFGWWLAASVLAIQAAGSPRGLAAWAWWGLPLAGGVLAFVSRPAAIALGVPVYLAVCLVIVMHSIGWTTAGRWRQALPAIERAALLGIVALALSLRWDGLLATLHIPLASDAAGYYEAAVTFHERVAAVGTNPIALAYLNMHSAARELLFPVLLRVTLDVLGEATLHLRYLSLFGALAAVVITYHFGRAVLGTVAGLGAALLLATEPWHILRSSTGLREETALVWVYGLATLVVLRPGGGVATGIAAGILAAAAILTRLDSAAVVGFLLVVWGFGLGRAWRRSLVAWGVLGGLVAPLLIGYSLRYGEALAPLGATMGGDIRGLIEPMLRLDYPLEDVISYFYRGTLRVYTGTIFAGLGTRLELLVGTFAMPLVLACFAGGTAYLAWRGPRLPAMLAFLGCYAPPFAFIAGINPDGGPYAHRYTYLVLPAAYAVLVWAASQPLARLAAAVRAPGRGWLPRRWYPG